MVTAEAKEVLEAADPKVYDKKTMVDSVQIFLEIVTAADFPEFLTTFLYNHSIFRSYQRS